MGADVGVGVGLGVTVGVGVGVGLTVGVGVGVTVGVGVGVGAAACITITSFGLPVAPVAVTRIVPVRDDVPVLAAKAQLIVPVLLPLDPYVIESQLPPDNTAAVQGIVPVPVLETLNAVVPEPLPTL